MCTFFNSDADFIPLHATYAANHVCDHDLAVFAQSARSVLNFAFGGSVVFGGGVFIAAIFDMGNVSTLL